MNTEKSSVYPYIPNSVLPIKNLMLKEIGANGVEDFFEDIPGREYTQRGLGSGFIIDEEGYILTNQHVIQNADKITVTLPDGRRFTAELKGSDLRSDLAVIKVDAKDLHVLELPC